VEPPPATLAGARSLTTIRARLERCPRRLLQPSTATLTLIFPCYNEAERLPRTLGTYLGRLSQTPVQVEVLVVDDGSTDGTSAVASTIAAGDGRVRVIRSEFHRGKGFAVRTGMLAAGGDLVVFTDADGSYGPEDVERIVAALADVPVAIGSRDLRTQAGSPTRQLASRLFNQAMRTLLDLPFRDTQCGLKGFRRQAALALFGRARLDGFAFDAEVLYLARHLDLQVGEVGVRADERDGSKVRVAVDALAMLGEALAVRRTAASGAYDRDPSCHPAPEVGPLDRSGQVARQG
jgi:dolichyl-phosphate beta-glucosyltransferase